ncbi:MAG: S4 domain-containing protein [Candidatus Asgardarchaeia archaeon]
MRLDEYLVKMGFFSSRIKAKRAILSGNVAVNETVITKPSYQVFSSDSVKVLSFEHNKPLGYFKLKYIDSQLEFPLIREGDVVLDVGSSAGGFILYALEQKPKLVFGVEYSKQFEPQLRLIENAYPTRVKIIIDDIMHVSLDKMMFDVILCDITAQVEFTLKVVLYLTKYVRQCGRLLFSLKLGKIHLDSSLSQIKSLINKNVFRDYYSECKILKSLEQKKEVFALCRRCSKN